MSIFVNQPLTLNVTVLEDGAAKDLTGATATVKLKLGSDACGSPISNTNTPDTTGVLTFPIAANLLDTAGTWQFQVFVTISGDETPIDIGSFTVINGLC